MHYYKFNIADWALATSHLSLEEEAIYFRLVNHYYDSEAAIPLETQSVFRRLRVGSDSVVALQILEEFFTKTEKGYTHDRCDALLKEYRKTAKTSRANGAKGGRPRNDAAHSETQDKPSGLLKETQPKPKHNLNQEPLTKVRRFAPPALQEVLEYCAERKNFVDPQRFIDHYTSNGWKVGKNQMKDWKAAVRTWEKSSKQESDKPKNQTPLGRALNDAEQLQAYYANEQASDSYVGQNESIVQAKMGVPGRLIDGGWEAQPELPDMVRSNGGFD